MSEGIQRARTTASAALIAIGTVLIVGAATLVALTWTGAISGARSASGPGTVTGFGSVLTAGKPLGPPEPASPLSSAALNRIMIPRVEIDAPIVVKGLDSAGVMQAPDTAVDVAWYDFSSRPGDGGNAVFSGHVDYVDVGPAVFWRLKDLQPGDVIQVSFIDGISAEYAVSAVNTFEAATAPVDQIVGATAKDSLTLITCAGTFDRQTQQYDQRLIVRAEWT